MKGIIDKRTDLLLSEFFKEYDYLRNDQDFFLPNGKREREGKRERAEKRERKRDRDGRIERERDSDREIEQRG